MSNSIMAIFPYKHQNIWVFDDEQAGLKQELFVSGTPENIDILVKNIPHANKGCRLLFSASFS